jgi:hypothetical protein
MVLERAEISIKRGMMDEFLEVMTHIECRSIVRPYTSGAKQAVRFSSIETRKGRSA